ncbi:MAG: hypothetical protein CSA20_07350 [Deltaproteobacteria bacterium]|nr:MAG: hypothetical protein CSB32_01015 [Desulfobacterales bacterium]PIE72551.1 MAG: hypothetical protein CSA20_07350 [Deltaproteobacteria bacterium]
MKKQIIIAITSRDRPGIIAKTTEVIYKLGGDVADLNQTVVCGYLSMILCASFQKTIDQAEISDALSQIETEHWFAISIKEIKEDNTGKATGQDDIYILTVQGQNRTGIVHGISNFCYTNNINITDLATTLRAGQYTMALQLDLTGCPCNRAELQEKIDRYAEENGLTILMQHNDIFRVTNEIPLH